MANTYTLADIRASLEKKYAPLTIDLGKTKVVLRNIMRLSKEERKSVQELIGKTQTQEGTEENLDELIEAVKGLVLIVAERNGQALANEIGDDLGFAMEVINLWNEATQVGEASNSPS